MPKTIINGETRHEILRAALKCFAQGGAAARCAHKIVADARLPKPAPHGCFR